MTAWGIEEKLYFSSLFSCFCATFAAESCETAHAWQSMQASLHSLNRSFAYVAHNRILSYGKDQRPEY
jgi:hypothetical protein